MAAINFPSGATPGQIHSENGKTWTFDGVSWISTPDKTNSITLGTDTVGQYAQNITTTGNGITVTIANANDGTQYIIYSSATSDNINESLVYRNNLGNFSATGISLSEFVSIGTTLFLNNSGYSIGLKAPNLSGDYTYILPSTYPQGTGTSVLVSNTNGVLSWTPFVFTGASGSGTVAYGNIYEIPFYPSAGFLVTGSRNFVNVGTGISILFGTNSSNTTSGALVVHGGVGITGNANIGGTVTAITFIGNLSGTAITSNYSHVSGYGLTSGLATTSNYSHISGYGLTSGLATTAINIYLSDVGSTSQSHYLILSRSTNGAGIALSTDSSLTFKPDTNILSVNNGSIAASGVTIGGSDSTITTAANDLILTSNTGNIKVNNNLSITGNLTVHGTTTSIGSTITTLLDPVIVLGAGIGGTNPLSDDSKDRGVEFRYFSGTAKTGFFGYDNSSGKFTFIPNATNNNEIFSGAAGTAVFQTVEANVLGNVTGTATTALNISLNATNIDSAHYLIFSSNVSGSGVALSSDTNLSYNPNSNTLTVDSFVGNLTGFASTARNLNVNGNSASNNDHFLLWSPSNGGSGVAVSSGLGLSYNPNSNTLKIGGIAISSNEIISNSPSINLFQSGIAISIGAGSGTLTLNNSNVIVNQNTVSTSNTTGALIVSGGVGIGGSLYSSSTNASSISGIVLNNSVITNGSWAGSTITSLYGGTGFNNYTDGDILVAVGNTFVKVGIGISGQILVADDSVDYKVRWSDNFVNNDTVELGTKTTGQYAKTLATSGTGISVTNANVDDGTDYTIYLNSTSANTGNALVLRNASGNFSANIITATLSGTATTASNIVVQNGSDNSAYYLTFVKPQTGSGVDVHSDSTLQFNPSTNILSASEITATNINGTIQTSSQPNITGLGNISSGTWAATAISTQYGGTGLISYVKGELLVGLGNTLFKLSPGPDNTILTADSFAAVGVTWKSILSPTFGAFGSTTTQTVSASNTTTLINFDTGFESNNITATGTTTRIYVNTTGVYNLQFNARTNLGSGIGASNGEIWFRLDGSNLDNSNAITTLAKQDSDMVMTVNYVKTIVAGSYLELAMSSLDSNFQIKTRSSTNGPTIPSMFMSVLPVSSVIAGGGSAISGIAQLNTLTTGSQSFATGKSGTSFNIQSSGSVHTFNIPDASTSAEGIITTGTQSIAGQKTFTGDIILSSTTNSTNLLTGALKVRGGLAVSENASFGSTIAIYASKTDNHLAFLYDVNKTEGNANLQLRHGNFLRFYATNDTTYLDLKAEPTSSYSITLPVSDGNENDILSRNSTGGLFYTSSANKVNVIATDFAENSYFIPFSAVANGPSTLETYGNLTYDPNTTTLSSSKLKITSNESAAFYSSIAETTNGVGGRWNGALYVAGGIAVSRNIIARNQISIGNTATAGSGRTFIDLFLSDNLSSDYIGLAFYDGSQTNATGARVKLSRNAGGSNFFNLAWGLIGNNNSAFVIGPTGSNFTGAQFRIATDNGSNALAVRMLVNKGRADRSDFTFGDGSNGHGVQFTHDRVTNANTNAGDWTIQASASSGTGNAGRIIFQAATAGTAATTTYNTLNSIFIISGLGVSILTTTQSSPSSQAALSVHGGVGISGNAFIGGTTNILSTAVSTSSGSGALVVSGGVGVGGSLYVAGTASSISGLVINRSVITSGTWAGSLITGLYGGTGFNSYTKGDILVGNGSTFIKLAVGANNLVLTADSNSATGLTWYPTAATGITTINGLSSTAQTFQTGTNGTDFNIVSFGNTHTFNIPSASSSARGLVNTSSQTFAGDKTFNGDLIASNSTESTSINTGALRVLGGVGIIGNAFIGGTITAPLLTGNVSAIAITSNNFYGNLIGTATTASNINIVSGTANTTHYLIFSSINAGSGVAVSSGLGLTYNPISKLLSLGDGNLIANNVRIGVSSGKIDTISGNLTIDSSGGNVIIDDNLSINGNLTVNGTTTTIDSTVTTLKDPIIVLGSAVGGTHPNVDDNKDRGIEFRYVNNSGTAKTGFFGYQDTTGYFTYIPDGFNNNEVFQGNAGTAKFDTVIANLSGIATTALNINVNTTSSNQYHSLIFTRSTNGGSGVALSTNSDIVYDPSNSKLVISAIAVTNSSSSTNSTSGALTVTGGVGIGGSLYVSGTASSISGLIINNSIVISGSWAGSTITSLYGGTGLTSIISANAFLSSDSSGTALTYRSILPGTGISVDENINNITVKTNIGSGTTNYIPLWINEYQLGNSAIAQSYNGSNYEITVTGHFKANTKSFLIPHPLDPENSMLEHGSLEGPEHGIYIRGKAQGINQVTVNYPDYWQALSDNNNTIIITSRCPYNLFVDSDDKNGFTVKRIGGFKLSKKRITFDYFVVSNRNDVKLNLIHHKGN